MDRYDAYVIDPDLGSRMRLKQATGQVVYFDQVFQASKIREAHEKIAAANHKIDLIFLSYRLDPQEVSTFISSAKQDPLTQDSAFVMMMRNQDQQSSTIVSSVLGGVDGLLFEPFSVQQLTDISILAAKVRKERSSAREEAAFRTLLTDITAQIDQVAYLKSCRFETGSVMKKLREMCAVFQGLSPESMETYRKLVVEVFESAPLMIVSFQKNKYSGVSARVQRRMEARALAALGASSRPHIKD